MSSDPTSSDSDNLRRSKRKKFKLDVVAAAHGNNQKKSRKDPHGQDEDADDIDMSNYEELSVLTDPDGKHETLDMSNGEEDTLSRRRTRRSTAHWQDYQDSDHWIENSGPYSCHKCPSRYESKSSLANHTKMHMGEKRKFACELCDFSSTTLKSLTHHNNIHKRFGVVSAQTSPAIPAASLDTSSNSSNGNVSSIAPQLQVAALEPFALELGSEDVEASSTTPPLLEREDGGPPVLEMEEVSMSESPPPVEPVVRKSNRPMKPTRKARKITPKKQNIASFTKKMESPKSFTFDPNHPGGPTGSLPTTSSSSSSVTPPRKRSPAQKAPSKNSGKLTKLAKKMKKSKKTVRCPHCPFMTSTVSRLNRHSSGHKLKEGYICPAKSCNFTCKKAGFLQKHYVLHKGYSSLPWPPKYVNKEQKKKAKKDVEENKKATRLRKRRANTVNVVAKAQIKSHIKVTLDNVVYKKCNVGDCNFQTVSLTQLLVHKMKIHNAKSIHSKYSFMCSTCGYRSRTYASLRAHKLTTHTLTKRRFHRTYYLKEIVGDKFFIKHFTGKEPEVNEKAQEPEKEKDQEVEDSGDESFDSVCSSSMVPAEALAVLDMTDAFFCCNLCPYKAPTMNRCQRHYDKHFTNDSFKCSYCTWSSRSREVIVSHEKLHQESQTTAENGKNVNNVVKSKNRKGKTDEGACVSSSESPDSNPNTLTNSEPSSALGDLHEYEVPSTSPLANSLRFWCQITKTSRPELDEQFTRKVIDGIKGFQCTDCPYTSKYRGDMRSHKKRHDIEQTYRCVQCTYTTNRPVSLKDHLKQHAAVNASLADTKSRRVVVNNGIQIGMRRGVGMERIYCCNKCPYVTLAIGCLWRHHRNHRNIARINICSNCSYSSIDQRKMEEHIIVHLALGLNEPVPFVKRVDQSGRPVSSLTDLNSEKMTERKSNKRKMPEKTELVEEECSKEKVKESGKEKKEKDFKQRPEKKRKVSNEGSPESDCASLTVPGPSQPTRTLSERATRNRINYSLLSKNGSGKPTPSSSCVNLEKLAENEDAEPEESVEVSHWKIRKFLRTEYGVKASLKCPECPYKSSDPEVLEKHRYFHITKAVARPYSCSDCTFNTYTPTALLQHLKVHSEGVCFDPMMKKMMKHRKGDSIPPGVKGYYCKNCSFKTSNHQNFIEHSAYHRQQLMNRINISLKRQPPKEEYQRPKMKHQFVAKNAKYCKKCTFKCVSQSNFIEHLDRHGWNQLYKCYICDYSDNNKAVVDFHQLNHHVVRDQTLHNINQVSKFRLENGIIQKPDTEKETPTPEEFVTKTRGLLKCPGCNYFCHVASELAFHMSVNHPDEPNAKETISYLHMGLIPPKASVTTV